MVNLALAYGAKGIFYYLYGSNADKSGNTGLVDENYVPNDKWYEVKNLNRDIKSQSNTLLNLNWETAFTATSTPGENRPSGVVNVWDIQEAEFIEVGSFTHNDGSLYFRLVNRKCGYNDSQTMLVEVNTIGQADSILDIKSNQYIQREPNLSNSFIVTLQPGEGRLYKIIE